MKKILSLSVVLLFVLLIAPVAQSHTFDDSHHLYDPEDALIYKSSLKFLNEGKIEEAVAAADLIKDYELKWWILY